MCHLILFLPIVTLSMLWLLPLSVGVLLYGLVLIVAFGVYAMVLCAMRRPVTAGPEALMHARGEGKSCWIEIGHRYGCRANNGPRHARRASLSWGQCQGDRARWFDSEGPTSFRAASRTLS